MAAPEVQSFACAAGTTSFQIVHSGRLTSAIPATASAMDVQNALNALASLDGVVVAAGGAPACSALSVTFATMPGEHAALNMIAVDGSGQKTFHQATRTTVGTVRSSQVVTLRCTLSPADTAKAFRFNVSSAAMSALTTYMTPASTPSDLQAAFAAVA